MIPFLRGLIIHRDGVWQGLADESLGSDDEETESLLSHSAAEFEESAGTHGEAVLERRRMEASFRHEQRPGETYLDTIRRTSLQ